MLSDTATHMPQTAQVVARELRELVNGEWAEGQKDSLRRLVSEVESERRAHEAQVAEEHARAARPKEAEPREAEVRLRQGRLGQGRLGQGRLRQGRLRQGRLRQGRLRQGRLRQEKTYAAARWRRDSSTKQRLKLQGQLANRNLKQGVRR